MILYLRVACSTNIIRQGHSLFLSIALCAKVPTDIFLKFIDMLTCYVDCFWVHLGSPGKIREFQCGQRKIVEDWKID